MGDPEKLLMLEAVLYVMHRDNLLCLVHRTGDILKTGLLCIQHEFKDYLDSTRGKGTFLSINAACPELRDEIVNKLKQKGVIFTLD